MPFWGSFGPLLGAPFGLVLGALFEPKDKETQWFWRFGVVRLGTLLGSFLGGISGPILDPLGEPFVGIFLVPFWRNCVPSSSLSLS